MKKRVSLVSMLCTFSLASALCLMLFLTWSISCASCRFFSGSVPWIAAGYFLVLLVLNFTRPSWILKISPYGLLASAVLSLTMQLTLFSICVPCYAAHILHVFFWTLCFYNQFMMGTLAASFCITSVIFPLAHFSFSPMHVDLRLLSFPKNAKGYVFTVIQPGCPFCLYELPYFDAFAQKWESKGLTCILLTTSENEELQRQVEEKAPHVRSMVYDAHLFQPSSVIDGYPFFIFTDARGRVLTAELGLPDDVEAYFDRNAKSILDREVFQIDTLETLPSLSKRLE